MVLPILKLGLSSSTKPVWKKTLINTIRGVLPWWFYEELTMKINYHSLYASSEPEPQETPHVSAWSLAPLPSSWEQFQASQMIEVRHMEWGLAVPVTSAKTNPDGPTPRYLSKHSQNQQICRGDHHWLQMHRQWLLIAECQFGSVSATLHHSSNRHLCRIYEFENGFKEVN